MRNHTVAAAMLLATLPLPALASSCAEQVATIQRRLDSAGAVSVGGPQAGHAVTTGSPRAVTAARVGEPSDPAMVPSPDRMAAARGLVQRASDEDGAGDKRACEDTMSRAKAMLGALP